MPEIAEVRTVARTLNKRIVGRNIIDVNIIYDKIIEDDANYFKEMVVGKTITKVDNYGKWLFIELGDITILSHLRMEGKYFIKDSNDEITKHEHIIFNLDDNTDLRYHDTRKFGRMLIVNTEDIYKTKEISKLGIEPDDNSLSESYLFENISKKRLPIKTLLLDQTIINGLGNIYVDEVLYAAKIHPETLGVDITLDDCKKIKEYAKSIIIKATESGGTTIRSYTSSLNVYGTYQTYLQVHTKVGNKCNICGSIIKKIVVGGRGTYFCPNCQKKK